MDTLYNCGNFIITKYTLIIYKVFASQNGLFRIYIHAPTQYILADIICKFRDITLPNIMDVINGTHVFLIL